MNSSNRTATSPSTDGSNAIRFKHKHPDQVTVIAKKFDQVEESIPFFAERKALKTEEDLKHLINFVGDKVKKAEAEKTRFTRSAGVARRTGEKIQAWITIFSDFLACYSGIIEIVKSAAGNKAQIPYSAISVLFIVCFMIFLASTYLKLVISGCSE
jgi:cytochrome b subunit of formate dehydrogenase